MRIQHFKIFSPGTSGPISIKLGMKHQVIKSIIIYSNGDPELTLTYSTARSNFVIYTFMGKCDNDGLQPVTWKLIGIN